MVVWVCGVCSTLQYFMSVRGGVCVWVCLTFVCVDGGKFVGVAGLEEAYFIALMIL